MKNQKIKYLVLSFFIPFFICLLIAYCKCFIFGGSRNVLVSDMHGQYVSLFSYLQDVFNGDQSLFYSFNKSIGGNMFGSFAYYLASPLNVILLLFSKVHLTWGILLLIMTKLSLSGLTMYIYLSKTFNKDKLILLLFSTSYAFIAYNVNYYFNIMWLDGVYLAPLILLGIDRLIKNKGSLLYGITLALALISNYYIGYMLCIFACLYFGYSLFINYEFKKDKEDIIKAVIKFCVTSLLAGLMSFILFLPAIIELQGGERAFGYLVSSDFGINFNIFDILSRTFIGSHGDSIILSKRTACIYSSLILLPLVYFYFTNKKFKLKEKIADGAMILIFILSIMIPVFNMVWHGMNFPNGFNYRFSFLLSLFLIKIACKSFWELKHIPLKNYLFFFIGYELIALGVLVNNYSYLSKTNVYISVACVGLYLLLLYNYAREKDKKRNNLIKYLIVIMVLAELFFNFFLSIRDYKVGYQKEYEGYMTAVQSEVDQYKSPNNDFYRIEKNLNHTYLDSFLADYSGFTTFLSTINTNTITFFNNIGGTSSNISIDYQDTTTPLMDSLMGLKYYFSNTLTKPGYTLIDSFKFSRYIGLMYDMEKSDVRIYENPDALSLGYMVNRNVKNFTQLFIEGSTQTNFDFQNKMLQTMVNSKEQYMKPYNIEAIDKNNYIIDVNNNENLYIMIPFFNMIEDTSKLDIYLNDEYNRSYNLTEFGIFSVDNRYANQKLKLTVKQSDGYIRMAPPTAYYLDNDAFKGAINILKENELVVEKQEKNFIKGTVNVTKDKDVLFTSIPYEKGWTIKVDGRKVDYYKVFDAFLAIDLREGTHEVEFTFYPPGLNLGMLITLISALIFAIFIVKENQILTFIKNIYSKYGRIVNYLIVGVLTTIVNFVAYVILAKVIGFDYITSSVISWIIAVLFAYITNKIFVFKSKTINKKSLFKEMYQFFKYRLLSLGVDLGIMFILVDIIYFDDVLAKLLVQFVIIVINYVFSKLFVFKL